jgi:hypothetical protein
VSQVLLGFGANDLLFPGMLGMEPLAASRFIEGLTTLAREARPRSHSARGDCAPLMDFGARLSVRASSRSEPVQRARVEINDWLRTTREFASVVDFAAALGDPNDPARLRPSFDTGDHLHPNDDGARAMTATVDLAALTRP